MAPGLIRRWLWTVAALAVGLSVLAGWITWRMALERVLDETARRGDNVLQLATSSLAGQLDRFERLPALIADQPIVRQLAADPGNLALVAEANGYLERIQRQLGATDIYLMDGDGLTVAASNHGQEATFIGRNFAFRPYFSDAIAGGTGRFYALGTTSQKRGYYFGAPIRDDGRAVGVLVFKIDLDAIEDAWRGGDYAVIVTDPDGVIFLSSRTEWLFQALRPLTEEARARIDQTRRYADTSVGLLQVSEDQRRGRHDLISVSAEEFLLRGMPMEAAGWQVNVLIDTSVARREALTAAMLAMLLVGLMALLGLLLWQQRLRLAERLQMQAEARADLERRVEERTAELRQAQTDLVQAGKLAALGQMSAALSHEFNQPLAAARTFADNAGVLLDRGRPDEARGNITRILGLIDRLATISRHLSSFARRPGQMLTPVALPEVIEASVAIAALRLKTAKADLALALAPDLPLVVAGPVRLQQVLVNILTNAADATEGQPDPRITLAAWAEGDHVMIRVTDNGPGVPEALRPRIFDPFFSTKGVGKGLGLGLSISYNIIKDFGGELTVISEVGGGAAFTIRLRRANGVTAELTPAMPSAAE
jgi:two-component system, NtrC family, C4-dicarboxylate transport sensor histidine kinase DctB